VNLEKIVSAQLLNQAFLCNFQPFLWRSFILISLMSKPLTIWILSVRSLLLFLLSAIAPKINVRSRAIAWFQRAMRPALSILHNSLQGTCHISPPPHASLNPLVATSLPPFWHSLTPFKGVSDALWRGSVVAIPYNEMGNIYCEHQKLGEWCSSYQPGIST